MEASDILYKNESFRIIGAAMEVHKVLGCGFVEVVYQEALEEEFKKRNIPYERGKELKINYKDKLLSKTFRADFICYDNIILELKAVHEFTDDHYAQNIFLFAFTNNITIIIYSTLLSYFLITLLGKLSNSSSATTILRKYIA